MACDEALGYLDSGTYNGEGVPCISTGRGVRMSRYVEPEPSYRKISWPCERLSCGETRKIQNE